MIPRTIALVLPTNEARLLIAAVRSTWDASAAACLDELVRSPLAWEQVLEKAHLHGLALFLQRALQAETGVPPAVREQLGARACAAAARSCILSAELLKILDALECHGVQALAVKGPALAALIYGNEPCRQFGDLDVLVSRQDFLAACELLQAHGYMPYFPLPRDRNAMFARCEYTFVRGRGQSFVDLHWALFDEYFGAQRDPVSIWERSAPVTMGGHAVRTMCSDDSMLYLCVHGAGHNWRRLDWVADVAMLGRTFDEARWRDLLARAEQLGARRMVLLGVRIAASLFGLEVVDLLARAIDADRTVSTLAARTCLRLVDNACAPVPQNPFYYLRTMDRVRDRARFVWKRVSTPPAWVLQTFPRPGLGLAHLLRPIQLLRGHLLRRRHA